MAEKRGKISYEEISKRDDIKEVMRRRNGAVRRVGWVKRGSERKTGAEAV